MKKMTENFKKIIFAIILLSSFNSFANSTYPEVKIIKTEKKIFRLEVAESKATDVTIRIIGNQEGIVLEENITISKLASKSYNLSKLPKGIYEVELENDISYSKQLVKLTYNGLEILENKPRKTFKPFVKTEDRFIILNHLTLGTTKVEVTIFDDFENELYSKSFENVKTIHKRFDMTDMEDNVVYVRIKTNDNTFRYRLILK